MKKKAFVVISDGMISIGTIRYR